MVKLASQMTVRELNNAIRRNPRDVGLWAMRALKHEHAGDLEAALADASRVVDLEHDRPDAPRSLALAERARLYAGTGRLAEAIADYTAAIRADEQFAPHNYGQRAAVFVRLGRFAEAAADYEAAIRSIELHPSVPCAYGLNDHRTALSWLRSTCPDDAVRDGAQAIELVRLALREKTSIGWPRHACLAAAYAETGDFAKAVEHQTEAIEQAAQCVGSSEEEFYARALALYREGKPLRDTERRGHMSGFYTQGLPVPGRATSPAVSGPLPRLATSLADQFATFLQVVCVAVIGTALALLLQFGIARLSPHSAPEPPAPEMTPVPDQGPLPQIPRPGNPPPPIP